MENYASGWILDGLREGTFAWPMPADRPLTLVSAADIGAFAALVLRCRSEFTGRRIDIASYERPPPRQIAEILTAAIGRPITHQEVPLPYVRTRSADLAAMFDYFTTVGLDVDVARLRRDHPDIGWHSFADWAGRQDWASANLKS